MAIINGENIDATDHEKNVVTYLEGINQATILSQNATVTDKVYTNAESDIFSDATGYNNHIDTGNTTAQFDTDRYSNINQGEDESGNNLELSDGSSNDYTMTFTALNDGIVTGIAVAQLASTVTVTVDIIQNSVIIASKSGQSISTAVGALVTFVTTDYSDHIKTSVDSGTFTVRVQRTSGDTCRTDSSASAFTGTDFSYSAQLGTGDSGAGTTALINYADIEISNKVLQTNAKTLGANANAILVTANTNLIGSATVTVDVSSDGGSVFEVSAGALNTVLTLDGDNTDVVLRFNLNGSTLTDEAEILGYSYQGWT